MGIEGNDQVVIADAQSEGQPELVDLAHPHVNDHIAADLNKGSDNLQEVHLVPALSDAQWASIDKHVPSEQILGEAASKAGIDTDPHVIRERMMAHIATEVAAGTLTQKDLDKPVPRVGAAYVATGALSPDELNSALEKQTEMRKAAEANGQKGPRLDAVLQEIYKDDPARLARLNQSSNFYDELKKLLPKN